jgi:uncharacterized membrane protein
MLHGLGLPVYRTPDEHGYLLTINVKREVVAVFIDTAGAFHGFLWHSGIFESIDVPGAVGTLACGINNRGETVGTYCSAVRCDITLNNKHGFMLRRGAFTVFDFPDADTTWPFSISARGEIAGGYKDKNGQHHAFPLNSR